jgi:hypothetical protein
VFFGTLGIGHRAVIAQWAGYGRSSPVFTAHFNKWDSVIIYLNAKYLRRLQRQSRGIDSDNLMQDPPELPDNSSGR